jgi:D-alanyl-D-alanine endopeptidase (penicillin-binding protein 7)
MIEFFSIILGITISFFNWLSLDGQLPVKFGEYFFHPDRVQHFIKNEKQEPACAEIIETKPVLKTDSQPFELSASSGLALDLRRNYYLFEKEADSELPIASISKLMAALVFLDNNPGWNKVYTIRESDKRDGNKLNFFPGEQVYVRDIFYSALVASDNSAIISLVSASGLSEEEFVKAMNEKAKKLGMDKTNFAEPTGLSDSNTSTARDVAKLIQESMKDMDIRRAVLADKYELEILNVVKQKGKKKPSNRRTIKNTDQLLRSADLSVKIIGGKTGYLNKAGYCFAGSFQKDEQQIITVVLGAANQDARFAETQRLLDWIFKNYEFPKS